MRKAPWNKGLHNTQFCPKGHDTFIVGRSKSNGCRECSRDKTRNWRNSQSSRDLKNSEFKSSNYQNPDGSIFTMDDYDKLFILQNGRCAICGIHQNDLIKLLNVDHSHRTNIVRGLLCHQHNLLLGHAADNSAILRNAAIYIEKCELQ